MHAANGPATEAVCVGETMALLIPDPPAPPDQAAVFRRDIGGAESNVAVHMARAGRRVAWHSAVGDDGFGRHLRERLAAEGVDCTVRVDPHRPTGLYLKELRPEGTRVRYYRQGSAASALERTDAEEVWKRRPRLVHTTGITAGLSDSSRGLVEELLSGRPGALRSFDVNYRPALHGESSTELLRELARRSDVVFCGLDEAQALWGVHTVDDVRRLLAGPDLVVVKQGAHGATAFRGDRSWHQPAPQTRVVEAVGAGDAFAAGVLDRLLDDAPIDQCLVEGSRLAGAALRVRGDIPPVGESGAAGPGSAGRGAQG
ncbi:sugar kinase [Allosalinactinospora lopnorensis]|uniref:sugar kinase n=1 Tax=Allosalinactinospora lopnorensis TaxID=1352348 RepID=UPI000B2EA82E|nr:sugar kinase [Allosalinactinospora lopnorensis]